MKKSLIFAVLVLFLVPEWIHAQASNRLIVYCGITMLKPMAELARDFGEKQNCDIQFVKGGSGKLLKLLLKNKNGDLYLPGSSSYVRRMETEYPGLVMAKAHVGANKAVIFVKKGNPKGMTPDLNNFHNEKFKVVIGSDEKGSIGKETKKILLKHGTYDKVKEKAMITLHSKCLVNAIKVGKADISINWYAVSTWPENKDAVDTLEISDAYANKKELVLSVLKHSKQPDLAKAFLEFASSKHGGEVFEKYGLTEEK